MFTQNSLNLAQIISKDIESRGLNLKVKTDSPLFDILQYVPLPDNSVTLESHELSKTIIKNTISIEEEGKVGYDFAMDETVKDLAPKLSRFISIMKNQINPFIVSLSEKVIAELAKLKQSDLYGINIVEAVFPDILTNNEFIAIVDQRKDETSLNELIPLRPLLPELSPAEVRAMVNSFPGLTRDLLSFIGNSDIDYNVYNGIFRHEYSKDGNIAYIFNKHPNALGNSVIGLILGLILVNDPPEGTTGTLDEYYNALEKIISQAALGVHNYISSIERAAKAGILVTGKTNNTVTVNPILYKQWMENGGDVEVIYGMTLSKNIYETISEIEEKKEHFLNIWNQAKSSDQLDRSFTYVNKAKETYRKEFSIMLDDEVASNLPTIGNDSSISKEKFNQLIEYISVDDLQEIYTLTRKLVCRSRYPDLFVELFLEEIDKACSKKKDLHVKDGALLATIVYVASVIASSIEVTRL